MSDAPASSVLSFDLDILKDGVKPIFQDAAAALLTGSCRVATSMSAARRRWRGRFADATGAAAARLVVAFVCALSAGCAPALVARGSGLSVREVAVLEAREPPRLGPIVAMAWSPDGARVASAGFADKPGDSNDVVLWDVAARRRIAAVPRASRSLFTFAFTPDSRLLAMPAARPPVAQVSPAPGPDHLSPVDARTGAVVGGAPSGLPPPPPGGTPYAIAAAPADSRAAAVFAGGPRGLVAVVYDAPAGADSWRPASDFALPWLGAYGRSAFSPDGGRLALAGGKETRPGDISAPIHLTIEVRDLRAGGATGRPAWAADLGRSTASALAWGGPDGGLVAVGLPGNAPAGTVGERVVALDGRTGARRWTARWPAAAVEGLAFSPDGRLLAAASRGDEVRVLDAATGETLLAIGGLRAPRAVAWGPAGPHLLLAFNDGPRVQIVEIAR